MKEKFSIRDLILISFLICLSVILRRFFSVKLPVGSITLGNLPIILSGFILGPISGFIAGALGDILSYISNPKGPYLFPFTITSGFMGFIPAFAVKILNKKKEISFLNILISVTAGQIITSIFMVPFFMELLLKHPFFVWAWKGFLSQIILIPVISYLSYSILKTIENYENK
jgi:ECF transporter S component (folate family)